MEYTCIMDSTRKRSFFGRARRKPWRTLALGVLLCACTLGSIPTVAMARADDNLLQDTFETDTNGWIGLGPHFHLGTTNEADKVKSGKSSLAFGYRFDVVGVDAGQLPIDAIARPVPNGQLAKMRSLSFWVRSDINAPLAVALQEHDGGRYVAVTWIPKNQWVHVVLTPEDFALSDGKDDPKDPDGKLDMDQVENISMLNILSFAAVSIKQNPAAEALFLVPKGEHTLWLDDLVASSSAPVFDQPEPIAPDKNGVWVDPLRKDTLNWMALGGTDLRIDKSGPIKTRSVRLDYTQEPGKVNAVVRDLHHVNLTPYDHLEFDTAGTKSAKLLVALEKRNGAKYNTVIDVAGDKVVSRKALYFSTFKLSDDSPQDPDNKLTLDQLKNITILDISGFINQQKQDETLWIGPIRATKG